LAERSPGRHRARPERGAAVRYALAAVVLFLGLIATAGLGAFAMPIPASAIIAPTLVYDRHGQLLGALAADNRIPVSYGQLPRDLQDAIVATEDKTFWTNIGIDPASLARAAYADILHCGIVQGGSTMTQELAKTLFLTEQRTFSRKFAEVFLALRLTATFSKRDIMTMYMNSVYFGEGAYGVGDAARVYFGVPVRQLSLPQAALLAGLVNAPSAYDPYLHSALALSRRNWVLHRMAAVGDITAVGLPISVPELTLFQKRIQGGVFGASNPTWDILKQLQMYRDGRLKLDELVTKEYKLDEVAMGFEDMHAGKNIRGVVRF